MVARKSGLDMGQGRREQAVLSHWYNRCDYYPPSAILAVIVGAYDGCEH
jgi:hypothetical protein